MKTVRVTVKAQSFGGVVAKKYEKPITIEKPVVKDQKASAGGKLNLIFDQNLQFPDNMYELTNENDGSTYFKCTLEIDEKNLVINGYDGEGQKRRLQSDDLYSFSWKILRTDSLNEIKFDFKFKNPILISKYGKDKMIIEFLKPFLFAARNDNRVNLES